MTTTYKPLKKEDLSIDPTTKHLQVDAATGHATGTFWDNEAAGAGDERSVIITPYHTPYTLYIQVSGATTITVSLWADDSTVVEMNTHTFAGAGELVWTVNHTTYAIRMKTSNAVTITAKVRAVTV